MGRSCLADALNSLAAQSYRQIEVVVVDATGGRHPPLPANIVADERFRLLYAGRPLKRPAAANFGLDATTGEYIGFLGVWVGEFSLSLSAARQRLVDVPPPRLLPVYREGARNTIQACRNALLANQ
jgi:hypothetical protein